MANGDRVGSARHGRHRPRLDPALRGDDAGLPALGRRRSREARARDEPERLLAGLGARPCRRRLAAGDGRAGRRRGRPRPAGRPDLLVAGRDRAASAGTPSRWRSTAGDPEPLDPGPPRRLAHGPVVRGLEGRDRPGDRRRLPRLRRRPRRAGRGCSYELARAGRRRPHLAPGRRRALVGRTAPVPVGTPSTATSSTTRCGCSTRTPARPSADLADEGRNLDPAVWSPVPGDHRLAFTSERGAFERPAIWDLDTGERRDIDVDLPGAVFPVDWWPDGSALLLRHEHRRARTAVPARPRLRRARARGRSARRHRRRGASAPTARSGSRRATACTPRGSSAGDGREVLANPDEPAPAGRPFRSVFVANPHGEEIQSFVVTPEGDGPFPTVLSVHGGPGVARARRVRPGDPGVRRRGVRGGPRELPGLDRLRRRRSARR